MKKAIKILAISLGVIILGFVLLAIALPLLIDPNDYKDEITQTVKEQTGRDLKIVGDLELSVFPWLGVEMAGVELANAPGFGKEPFAKVASAGVRVKVLPLLSRELVVDTVYMDGLELNLMRNRAGATNWDDLAGPETEKPAAEEGAAPAVPGIAALTVGGINIRNGKIRWLDQTTATRYAVHDLELKSGQIVPGEPVDLRVGFDLEGGDPPLRTKIELNTRATLDLERQTFDMPKLALDVDDLALKGNLRGSQIIDAPALQGSVEISPFDPRPFIKKLAIELPLASSDVLKNVGLKSEFSVDLGSQTLTVTGLNLTVDDLALNANLKGSKILDAPRVSGALEMPSFRPSALLDLLAIELDPALLDAFADVSMKTEFSADLGRQVLDVSSLSLTAGDLALTGGLKVRQLDTAPRVNGQITVATVDLRPLMKKLDVNYETAEKNTLAKVSFKSAFTASEEHVAFNKLEARLDESSLAGTLKVRNFSKPAYSFNLTLDQIDLDRYLPPAAPEQEAAAGGQDVVATLPLGVLRDLNLEGQAHINKLKAFSIRSSNVAIKLSAKNGLVTVGPNQAALYGGRYSGKTVVDARSKTPKFTINEKLTNVQLGPFLKDADVYDKLSGIGDVSMDLTARGSDTPTVLKTLNGKGTIRLRNGKIQGVNLQQSINDAKAKYDKLRGKPVKVRPKVTDETIFSHFSGTLNFSNGVARNNDLSLQGANLRASGKGTANLPKETIDYRLLVTLAEGASRKGTTVPIDIRGTFSAPEFNVAWNEVLKAQAKKKIEKKIEEKKEKKKEELEDKLKKKLKDKLKLKF